MILNLNIVVLSYWVIQANDGDRRTNSVDPDKNAPLGAV